MEATGKSYQAALKDVREREFAWSPSDDLKPVYVEGVQIDAVATWNEGDK